jgi:CheY-like chemotaxis protein
MEPSIRLRGNYLLVVDDDEPCRLLLAEVLREVGHQVLTACNGLEAMELMTRVGAPRAILLDMAMPVMGGEEFLRLRQTTGRFARVPVVVVSGERQQLLDKVGSLASEVLQKPVRITRLLHAIDEAADSRCHTPAPLPAVQQVRH